MERLNRHDPVTDTQPKGQPLKPSPAYVERFLIFLIVGSLAGLIVLGVWWILGKSEENEPPFFNQANANDLETLEKSIVNVVCPEAGKPFDFSEEHVGGTGYVLNDTGKILTNFHIIASEENSDKPMNLHEKGCFVLFPDKGTGYSYDTYIAKPIYYRSLSPDYDFAYMQIYDVYKEEGETYGEYPRSFPPLNLKTCKLSDLSLGDEVYALGYPGATEGYYLTLAKGIISAFSSYDSFYTSANLGFGGSGGVVIAPKQNCLAGIYSGVVFDDHVSYGEVYSGDSMLEFIEKSEKLDEK